MKTFLITLLFCFASHAKIQTATFAGGCFWCIESAFDDVQGVVTAISGYSNGPSSTANYKSVSSGNSAHYESVQIKFDDTKTSYKELLEIFWKSINPTDSGGQFADRGPQYKTAIFYHDPKQKKLAEESKLLLTKSKIFRREIIVPILKNKSFYKAEDNHQDYHKKSPIRYKSYYYGSGRGTYLNDRWSKHKGFKIFK